MLALLLASPTEARRPNTSIGPCPGHSITAKQFAPFADSVWPLSRWQRGKPKATTVAAARGMIECAAGPGHRRAMLRRWQRDRRRFFAKRHHCRSGYVVQGRVSVFGGGLEASGHYTSEPGIALNIDPSSEPSGWNNPLTQHWIATLQRFRVTINGHSAVLPVTDAGPASWTGRAIDVTEGGAAALGLSVSYFPTDSIGTARLLPDGC